MRTCLICSVAAFLVGCAAAIPKPGELVRRDHYVSVKSSAPGIMGFEVRLYLREVVLADAGLVRASNSVVLLVHGSGGGSGVFDVGPPEYSWMAHLARAGFDVFAVDLTGYGHSTRPPQMDDPCNLPKRMQLQVIPRLLSEPCSPTHPTFVTSMESEWNDIDAAVEYLRAQRGQERISLVGWSQGGPRIGGYAVRHPGKLSRLFALAPVYERDIPSDLPSPLPADDGIMRASSSDSAMRASWRREVSCSDQYEEEFSAAIWHWLLATETADGKWSGIRRSPIVPTHGFNQEVVATIKVPFAVVAPQYDTSVPPDNVRLLFEDLGSTEKVFVDLACSTHYAVWERNRHHLFDASVAWLRDGAVNGVSRGVVKLGY